MFGVKHNGTSVLVQELPGKKMPALTVQFDGDVTTYKVATFTNERAARWFCEVLEEFFEGLTVSDPAGKSKEAEAAPPGKKSSYDGCAKHWPPSDMLEFAKEDIASLLWLDGRCEYCRYGKKDTYFGAVRWGCTREKGAADCKPKWRYCAD